MATLFNALMLSLFLVAPPSSHANPYPDSAMVPRDGPISAQSGEVGVRIDSALQDGRDVLRVQVDWSEVTDSYSRGIVVLEDSGTDALFRRSRARDSMGSYHGILRDARTGAALAFDAVGTGKEFRKLVRAMTFRFPPPSGLARFEMLAEHPVTGAMEKVVEFMVDPAELTHRKTVVAGLEIRRLVDSVHSGSLRVNIYAEGYDLNGRSRFFQDASRVVNILRDARFPLYSAMEFSAVFAPSDNELGFARYLGLPVPERNSFLGLYFPYWNDFGRWHHVVYPTREFKFRDGIAQAPYDYAIVLVDSAEYWGIGNYKELTAIPSRNRSFSYLLLHELGHFFGLNEEYEGGGRTELEFAPEIEEPWSQNITFLRSGRSGLKWRDLVADSTPVPTPESLWWQASLLGAYGGGYGDSAASHSHKPGYNCVMSQGGGFCSVCRMALEENIRNDMGKSIN